MWLTTYRHKVKQRPKQGDWLVQIFDGSKLVQVVPFTTCTAALSFVERREDCQLFTPF
jgi:hypothetical protein